MAACQCLGPWILDGSESFGDQQTKDANLIVARMVVLWFTLHLAGRLFSVENPWDSFL